MNKLIVGLADRSMNMCVRRGNNTTNSSNAAGVCDIYEEDRKDKPNNLGDGYHRKMYRQKMGTG